MKIFDRRFTYNDGSNLDVKKISELLSDELGLGRGLGPVRLLSCCLV